MSIQGQAGSGLGIERFNRPLDIGACRRLDAKLIAHDAVPAIHSQQCMLVIHTESQVDQASLASSFASQPGLTCELLINPIAVAINPDTSVMFPGTIIVLLVLASDW